MGVHAGVFFFDGRPTEDERRRLIAGMRPLAGDRVSVALDRGVVLMQAASDVWAGARASGQSGHWSSGRAIAWDGRLDNREDLRRQLGGILPEHSSDAAIALTIFERWGVQGLRSLIGDWSLAVWDSRQRALHVARDYMGIRPLYYCCDAECVMWSTSLGELATRADRADALDEGYVARFMALRLSADETPYTGIRGVPPAHCVSFTAAHVAEPQRFWHLEPGVIRHRDKSAYEEQLRGLWREAVGARLRAEGTVWAELSGGLDSSSVVCMADALIKERRVAATAIQPLSHVTLESPEGDERTFIAEVEAQIGVRSVVLGAEAHEGLPVDDGDWATPLAPSGVELASMRHVQRHGGRVVLSGRLGDVVMGCWPDNSVAVLDDLAAGHLFTGLANMRAWSRACRKPFVEIAAGLVTEALGALLADTGDRSPSDVQQAGVDLLTPTLGSLAQPAAASAVASPRPSLSKRWLANAVLGYSNDARLEPRSEIPDIVYTYPFAHRPLVEFVLSIPGGELSAPGVTRSLMRRAFRGLVPDRVLRRVSKGHYSPAVMRAIRPRLASLASVDQLAVVRRGWIDRRRLDAQIRLLSGGGSRAAGELQRVLCLEDWLILRDRRAPAAIRQREEVTTNGVLIA